MPSEEEFKNVSQDGTRGLYPGMGNEVQVNRVYGRRGIASDLAGHRRA